MSLFGGSTVGTTLLSAPFSYPIQGYNFSQIKGHPSPPFYLQCFCCRRTPSPHSLVSGSAGQKTPKRNTGNFNNGVILGQGLDANT